MKKIKLGFIGAGWWATSNHMPILVDRDDVIFDSVCRLGKSELNQVKEKFGFDFATENYHELLDRDLDGVIVSSPHTLHFEHSKAALSKGINVLCEKPMTTSSEESRELVDIAEKNNLHLMMSHGWHYAPFVQKAKNLIDQGIIGDIESIVCHMASPTRELLEGKDFLRGADASGEIMFSPESNTWADPVRAGGGYGYAQMSHSLALTFLLVNVQPKEVFAYMSSPTSKVELYDSIVAKFENGIIGSFSGSSGIPGDSGFQVQINLFGTEGTLLLYVEWGPSSKPRFEILRHDGKHQKFDLDSEAGNYVADGPPNNFADLLTGKNPENWAPGYVGLRSTEILSTAYKSSVSGKPEKV